MALLSGALPENHPDVDVLLRDPEHHPLPGWHPSLDMVVTRRSIWSPGLLLTVMVSAAFMVAITGRLGYTGAKKCRKNDGLSWVLLPAHGLSKDPRIPVTPAHWISDGAASESSIDESLGRRSTLPERDGMLPPRAVQQTDLGYLYGEDVEIPLPVFGTVKNRAEQLLREVIFFENTSSPESHVSNYAPLYEEEPVGAAVTHRIGDEFKHADEIMTDHLTSSLQRPLTSGSMMLDIKKSQACWQRFAGQRIPKSSWSNGNLGFVLGYCGLNVSVWSLVCCLIRYMRISVRVW